MYTLHTFVCIIVCMKKRINIMLSEEAIATADESGNRSQYIEDLILQKAVGPQSGGDIENKLDTILEILSRPQPEVADINIGLPNITTADKIVSPTANRDLGSIRNDIQLLEDEMAQALEENQDPQYGRELNRRYTKQIDELWKEYHATKQTN